MAVELTEENLRHYYLELNTPLSDMPEVFGVSLKKVRTNLALYGIKKTQKQAAVNGKKTSIDRYGEDFYRSRGFSGHPEYQEKAKANALISRRKNRLAKLAAEGITYESLHKAFIEENLSITATGERFKRTKPQMRKLLTFFELTKSDEAKKEAKTAGTLALYSDEKRKKAHVAKVGATIAERYGHNWYRATISREEEALLTAVRELFKGCEVVSGDYSRIRNPATKHMMQLDIVVVEKNLAIEYNGLYWHDRGAYEQDLLLHTANSREMVKQRLCEAQGLRLVQVWSDEWKQDPEFVIQRIATFL